jgi:hypothetical protein
VRMGQTHRETLRAEYRDKLWGAPRF